MNYPNKGGILMSVSGEAVYSNLSLHLVHTDSCHPIVIASIPDVLRYSPFLDLEVERYIATYWP